MKGFYSVFVTLGLSVFVVQASMAEETEKSWEVSAELGAISTTGNTETTSYNGKLEASHKMEKWHNSYVLSGMQKKDTVTNADDTKVSEKTADKYFLSMKSAYSLVKEHSNLFVFASHANDEFGAYLEYSAFSAGYGTRLLSTDSSQFDVEIGPGYYWGEKSFDTGAVSESGAMLRAAGTFSWQISDSAQFKQEINTDVGEDNTRIVSNTSLSSKVNDRMQMKVGYTVSHDSEVAVEKEATDTTTYVNLVYNF